MALEGLEISTAWVLEAIIRHEMPGTEGSRMVLPE